ncbi:MAG: nitroreductase family protein, partial [Desulfurococcaceae archaeon]
MEAHLEFLKSRRSIRKFRSEPPPRDLILKAVDAARFAPSAKNSQPWRFIVVEDPQVKNKLA